MGNFQVKFEIFEKKMPYFPPKRTKIVDLVQRAPTGAL
jgi:hypothetical protein